jgi:hypothetical protein
MRLVTGLLIAATSLATAACAPMQWVKADATPQQASTDAAACQQAAWREAQLRSWHYQPIAPLAFRHRFGYPYFAWPYGPFSDPFGNHFMEESRLAQFCMRNKGYELVPVEPKKQLRPK